MLNEGCEIAIETVAAESLNDALLLDFKMPEPSTN